MTADPRPDNEQELPPQQMSGVREEHYRALFDSIDEGVCLIERLPRRADGLRDYRYLAMNPAMQQMFSIPDLSGQSMRDNFPDKVEDWYDDYDRVLETGRAIRFQRESVPQGKTLDMYLARIEDGSATKLFAVMQDITERRRAQEALARSEGRFRALVQASSDVVFCMNVDWSEVRSITGPDADTNEAAFSSEALERSMETFDRPRIRAAVLEGISNKVPFELEHAFRRADGTVGWCDWRAVPLLDSDWQIVEWVAMARDITERKRESESKYRSLFESIDEGFCIIEMLFDEREQPVDYRLLEVNPAFERQTGLQDVEGRRIREILPAYEGYWIEILGRVARSGEPTRFRNRVAALHRWYDVYVWRYGLPQHRQVAVLFNDVTDRVQAMQSLRELNESLEARVEERTRQLRVLAGRLTLAELAERRRVSKILHDDLQQLLYGIEMKLSQVEAGLPKAFPALLRSDLQEAHAWLGNAITATRRLTVDLSPPILQKEGLVDALQWLQRQMRELHGMQVKLEAAHAFFLPDQELRVLLFQVVRELLFNVKKHAGTLHATVRLEEAAGEIVVHVIDGGIGFDVAELSQRTAAEGGFGLSGARERLELIGGRLAVRSRPGEGAHLEIHVPLAPERRVSRTRTRS